MLVEVRGLEPPASWSQTKRATNCATPRNYCNYWSFCGKVYYTWFDCALQAPIFLCFGYLFLTSILVIFSPITVSSGLSLCQAFILKLPGRNAFIFLENAYQCSGINISNSQCSLFYTLPLLKKAFAFLYSPYMDIVN